MVCREHVNLPQEKNLIAGSGWICIIDLGQVGKKLKQKTIKINEWLIIKAADNSVTQETERQMLPFSKCSFDRNRKNNEEQKVILSEVTTRLWTPNALHGEPVIGWGHT